MHKYLVQTIHDDHFNADILVTVLQVLQLIESEHGTIVVVKHDTDEGWSIDPYFLNDVLELDYIFSDDEKYKEHLSWEN